MIPARHWLLPLLLLLAPWQGLAQALPAFSPTGPDAELHGATLGYPLPPRGTAGGLSKPPYMVGAYSNYDSVVRSRVVARDGPVSPLRRAPHELAVDYGFRSTPQSLQTYLQRHPVTGLLIARDDTILFEHYQYDRRDTHRFLSQSMAKTITALLIGIAVRDGHIKSLDDMASAYVPGLAGSPHGETSIRNLLRMAAGIPFTQTYEDGDDRSKLNRAMFARDGGGTVAGLAQFTDREAPAGTVFRYTNANSVTLGLVLTAATGQSLADYASRHLWRPLGAERDAVWAISRDNIELGSCCFAATLRDWARLGLMLAHDGQWNGKQIVPAAWVREMSSTAPDAAYLRPRVATGYYGYGYQTWLLPGERRQFALLGLHGQVILVDPPSRTVLVHTAVRLPPNRDPDAPELLALWRAVVAAPTPR